ncbi:hypothetical protein PR202_gb25283 [Eleusine coracana subsp. coracana]|uniref:Uncharacterized protein n=1 Tax=Eleusine coracana subsp. coracana TaxID=191504 RepID=A0AAV5FNK2_ELECO|nr:hypothetical protein PR202_gb25283 [Eleusine coracana subsp. coracana]
MDDEATAAVAPSHGSGSVSAALVICLFATASCLCLCCWFVLINIINNKKKKKKKKKHPVPPGRGSSLWWSLLETMAFVLDNSSGRGFYHFVEARHRRYDGSPCFRTSLFGRTHVFVSSSDAATSILAADDSSSSSSSSSAAAVFSKRYVRTVAELLGEHSLLCASHHRHRSLRRAIAPLFFKHHQFTTSLASTFDELTIQEISNNWSSTSTSSSSSLVVLDAALCITFQAICSILVATLLHDKERLRQMQSDVLTVTQAMLAFPLRMPGTRFHAGLQVRSCSSSFALSLQIPTIVINNTNE